jgi:hypothetical protein
MLAFKPVRQMALIASFLVAAHNRHARLDLMHSQFIKQPGNPDFFPVGKYYSRRLFPVSQGSVDDDDVFIHYLSTPQLINDYARYDKVVEAALGIY